MQPHVSICVPTYNRSASLRTTLQDLLKQTYTNWEIIVCDDASTDDTEAVVRSFVDPRIRYHRNPTNLGIYPNWNAGIRLAQGKYIAIYHDHDTYLPTIVERSVRLLDQYPQASFVHTALLMVDTLNMPLSLDIRSLPELLAGDRMRKLLAQSWASPVMAATAMVRRDAYQRVGLYRDHRYGLGCDLDMWFRLAGCGDVAYINEPQAFIRVRQRGDKTALFRWTNTVGLISMQHDFIEEVFRDRFGDYYLQRFRHFFQRDRLLFNVMLRALLLEPAHVVAEGQPIVHKQASIFTRMVLGLVGRSYALQQMLKTFVAPIHYSRITNNMNANKSQVYHYVATNQEIHDMLDSLQTQSIG